MLLYDFVVKGKRGVILASRSCRALIGLQGAIILYFILFHMLVH